jgi:uncharacterized membrane protein YeaQ/YmgE (transglycosylase-associated protein family)
MEQLLGILFNSAVGGGGGFLGNLVKKNGLSLLMNIVSGAIGGNAANILAGLAGAGFAQEGNDFSIASILTSLIGGGAGSLLGGLLGGKKAA